MVGQSCENCGTVLQWEQWGRGPAEEAFCLQCWRAAWEPRAAERLAYLKEYVKEQARQAKILAKRRPISISERNEFNSRVPCEYCGHFILKGWGGSVGPYYMCVSCEKLYRELSNLQGRLYRSKRRIQTKKRIDAQAELQGLIAEVKARIAIIASRKEAVHKKQEKEFEKGTEPRRTYYRKPSGRRRRGHGGYDGSIYCYQGGGADGKR